MPDLRRLEKSAYCIVRRVGESARSALKDRADKMGKTNGIVSPEYRRICRICPKMSSSNVLIEDMVLKYGGQMDVPGISQN